MKENLTENNLQQANENIPLGAVVITHFDLTVKPATMEDIKYIIALANKEGKSIGFIPKIAYESAIQGKKPSVNRWSDTCNDKIFMCYENASEANPDPVGFVMMSYGRVAKVNQICIQEDARLIERGKALLNSAIL
jgi:hypothetical protein